MTFLFKQFTISKFKISFATIFWFTLAFVAAAVQSLKGIAGYNNYLIFKGVFVHTISQLNLFSTYPLEYVDSNHYGSFFSLIIAPFTIFNNSFGCFLWCLANAFILFYAISKLPISAKQQSIILLISALEMMTSIHNVQFNPMLTSTILLSYILVKNGKDFWATIFIVIGILTKIYGIVGLAFFLFSNNKITFIWSFIFWIILCFCLPMAISSPHFVVQSYFDWYQSLTEKNQLNADSVMQGMTAMRFLKRILHLPNIADIYFLLTAVIFYLLPIIRFKQYFHTNFQLSYLAFLLIGVVIFSSSAESATFVIAMVGIGIWYILQDDRKWWVVSLLILALLFTSLSTTDLFPKNIKANFIRPYAIKAMPCFFIWIVISVQLLCKSFASTNNINE